jgi:tetratricopeptide (TPR) repeat protein
MRKLALLTYVICVLPLLGLTTIELERRRVAGHFAVGEAYYVPPAPVVRTMAFGYNELAADFVWLRTITYFATHLVGDRDFSHLRRYLETILTLDPHFKQVYRYGASMLLSRGERQTNADVFTAIELYERAQKLWPEDWRYPLGIGTYYLTELKPDSPEQKQAWRRTAAEYIRRATLVGANLPWLPTLAAKIYSEQGERQLAIRHLKELYMVSPNKKTRTQIAAKLRHLQDAELDYLRREARAFDKRYRASELRFLPTDLYVLVRLEPLPPFSFEAVLGRRHGPAEAALMERSDTTKAALSERSDTTETEAAPSASAGAASRPAN